MVFQQLSSSMYRCDSLFKPTECEQYLCNGEGYVACRAGFISSWEGLCDQLFVVLAGYVSLHGLNVLITC